MVTQHRRDARFSSPRTGACAWAAESRAGAIRCAARHETRDNGAVSPQLSEKRSRFNQIGRIQAFGEGAVHRRQNIARRLALAAFEAQACLADACAQLEET